MMQGLTLRTPEQEVMVLSLGFPSLAKPGESVASAHEINNR